MANQRLTFSKSHRIGGFGRFAAIRAAAIREVRGPLVFWVAPNHLGHCRLGISIPRRAGNAVQRNQVKRLLREAFRLKQQELPKGYDVLIGVRAHRALCMVEYQQMLESALNHLHSAWQKRKL